MSDTCCMKSLLCYSAGAPHEADRSGHHGGHPARRCRRRHRGIVRL